MSMKYTNLGNIGLQISRLCLGCMSYGDSSRGGYLLTRDEDASRAPSFASRSNPASTSSTRPMPTLTAVRKSSAHATRRCLQTRTWTAGFTPIVDDVVLKLQLAQYRKVLSRWPLRLIVLAPPVEVAVERDSRRAEKHACREEKIAVIPWSPLARGKLARDWDAETNRSRQDAFSGVLFKDTEEADKLVVQAVRRIASKRGVPMAQVALAWLLHKSAVTSPIVGATRLSQLDDAVAALDLDLSQEEIDSLEAPYIPHAVKGLAQRLDVLGPPRVRNR